MKSITAFYRKMQPQVSQVSQVSADADADAEADAEAEAVAGLLEEILMFMV